jgi:predicted PurR-regulated permease PerM
LVALLLLLQQMRVLLVPIALAGLASIVLYPCVLWLERLRIPPAAGAGIVVLLIFGAIGWLGWSLQDEATQMARELPRQIRLVRLQMERTADGGTISRLREALEEMRKTAATATQPEAPPAETSRAAAADDLVSRYLWLGSNGIIELVGHATVITFLSYFLLSGARSLRRRLLALLDRSERKVGSEVLDEIAHQVQRFLVVRVVTAMIVGVATWIALSWLGAPAAGLWSAAAAILNSVPFFGPLIVSVGLAAVGLISGGFTEAFQYGGAALVITSIEGWLITPPLLGQATRMNTLAVFFGLLLWSWLWGVWGTLLAVPLLSVVKTIADRVETLRPVSRALAP